MLQKKCCNIFHLSSFSNQTNLKSVFVISFFKINAHDLMFCIKRIDIQLLCVP